VPNFYNNPHFVRWLARQKPRNELIVRIALRRNIVDPAASHAWNARIGELEADLIRSVDNMAELLIDVGRVRDKIERKVFFTGKKTNSGNQ